MVSDTAFIFQIPYVFLVVRHFLWYQGQGNLLMSRSNIKVAYFKNILTLTETVEWLVMKLSYFICAPCGNTFFFWVGARVPRSRSFVNANVTWLFQGH